MNSEMEEMIANGEIPSADMLKEEIRLRSSLAEKEQYQIILKLILENIENGRCAIREKLFPSTKKELERKGYLIKEHNSQREGIICEIIWEWE